MQAWSNQAKCFSQQGFEGSSPPVALSVSNEDSVTSMWLRSGTQLANLLLAIHLINRET
jgi:hypothetical protein